MRLRFEAIDLRRAIMTNTITANITPATTRTIVVGSMEALSSINGGTLIGAA